MMRPSLHLDSISQNGCTHNLPIYVQALRFNQKVATGHMVIKGVARRSVLPRIALCQELSVVLIGRVDTGDGRHFRMNFLGS